MNQEPDLRQIVTAAASLSAAGSNDEALRVLDRAGRAGQTHPVVRNVAGDIYLKLGRKREALKAFDVAVKNAPGYPEAHCNRGVALQQLGRIEEAVAAFDRALKLRPAYAIAHFNRGNALRDLRRHEDAIAAYGRAVALKPDFPEAYLNRGQVFLRSGQPVEALDDFSRALRLRQSYSEAETGRIDALNDLHRHREALEAADRFIEADPESAPARTARALALLRLGRKDAALAAADDLLKRHPGEAAAHALRSSVLRELTRFEDALEEAREACRLAPALPKAHLELASAQGGLGDYEGQLASIARAEKLGATWRDTAPGRAHALNQLGRREEAGAIYRRLLALHPGDADVAYGIAWWLLEAGDYARGFASFEQRLDPGGVSYTEIEEFAPRWLGEALPGKKLFIYGEQGLGDTIQFARFLPQARESGARITLRLAKPLQRLFREIAAGMNMVDALPAERPDAQVSIMSLAHIFGARRESLPRPPYLRAEPELVEKWRGRIGDEGFKIGIIWQGNVRFSADRFRSAPLAKFAPVAALPGVRLISLQAINGLDQLDSLPEGMRVETLGPEISHPADGLVEIAAAMANLDLFLTIDSGVGHLAGALGQPTFLLVRGQPEWRWPHGEVHSAWYPSTRIFRQRKLGDWEPEIADVVEAVKERLGG
jgi:tetratricopeptide (TPR) repeat protein